MKWLTVLLLTTSCLAHTVELNWFLSSDTTPKKQKIYRSHFDIVTLTCNAPILRATVLKTATTWTDANVVNGRSYCYFVTVVDVSGAESNPRDCWAFATIPTQ
jgi:hypothetical protein